jgi:hypothetical protein
MRRPILALVLAVALVAGSGTAAHADPTPQATFIDPVIKDHYGAPIDVAYQSGAFHRLHQYPSGLKWKSSQWSGEETGFILRYDWRCLDVYTLTSGTLHFKAANGHWLRFQGHEVVWAEPYSHGRCGTKPWASNFFN